MTEALDLLTRYSTLILAVITGVYVILTWRMVSELRSARLAQADANIIAVPVPMGPVSIQVEMYNAGPGPALELEISIALRPQLDTPRKTWRNPALLVGQKEHFLVPTPEIEALGDLGEKYEELFIELSWKNVFGARRQVSSSHNLQQLAEGWYEAGHLIPPGDVPGQMKEILDVLKRMRQDLDAIARSLRK